MIPSSGNNQFKDNKFDYWTWSAPILQTHGEVVAKIKEMRLVGRTIKDIQAVGHNYYFSWYERFCDIFEAIQRGDEKALETLEFPCGIVVDEPILIQFEDGDILGIDFSEASSIRMELNTLPWDIEYGTNRRNFHANRMFKDILGRRVGDVFITTSMTPQDFTGSHGLGLDEQSSYLYSVSFRCMFDGQDHNIPRLLSLNFEPDFDYGWCCLNNKASIMTQPARCIKEVMEGYLTTDDLEYYLS